MDASRSSEAEVNGYDSALPVEEALGIFPLPLTPLERFLVRCDTRNSSMVIRVVMRFTGECQSGILI